MNPVQPQDQPVQDNSSIFQKLMKFKRILIPLFILVLILIPLTFLISSKNKSSNPPLTISSKSKMWEIRFAYDTEKQVLTVKNVTLKDGRATSSNLGLSSYKLQVLDKNKKIIYKTDIHITERILNDIYIAPEATGSAISLPPQPKEFEDIVYIPYLPNAQKAEVLKNGTKILEFTFPKNSSFSLINQAYAQGGECTTDLKIAFVSDGYTDESSFTQDVNQITNIFRHLNPYSDKPEIFDFRSIYNTVSLGCKNGIGWNSGCFNNQTETQVKDIVYTRFPELEGINTDHLKFVVLVDSLGDPPTGSRALGVFTGPGGEFGMFAARENLSIVAPHEVLGHGVGYLYDRYIYSSNNANSQLKNVSPESNCSGNPQGAPFWSSVSGSQASPGCTSQYMYAPYPRDCGTSGSRESMMSAANCGSSEFDPVEQAWIRNNVLPDYQGCTTGGNTTPNPTITSALTPTSSPAPTITQASQRFSISGNVWTDVDDNNVKNIPPDTNYQGATVKLTGNPDKVTDSFGNYSFPNLSPGSYTLTFLISSAPPYPVSVGITDSDIVMNIKITGSSTVPTLVPQNPTPTPTQGGGSGGATPTPSPTPIVTYNCHIDPTCTLGQKNLQLCPLICTPN